MSDSIFQLSKKDVMGGKTYDPAWYRIRIDSYANSPSKNLEKPSVNHVYEAVILMDADTGDTKYAEHPLTIRFNSLAMGFTKGLLMALGVSEDDIKEGARFDFKSALGKEVDAYVDNKLYDGRMINDVTHKYRAPRRA
jgi:hypothetical protein